MNSLPTCRVTLEGNMEGHTLVFIHGWPDSPALWRKQVAALADRYRCVLLTLPNFGDQSDKAGGYDFPQLVQMLLQTIDNARNGNERVTLVTHDWGAYIGYQLEKARPDLFERMVAFDIGGHAAPEGFKSTLFLVTYQWLLVAFWLIGGIIPPLGQWLTRALAALIGVHKSKRPRIRSRFNYPYFYLWRGMLVPKWRKNLLGSYRPACPVLYLFGKKKPVMFHSAKWLEDVEASGGAWQGIQGAGHWLMETHPGQVNPIVEDWLLQSRPDEMN